MASPARLQAEAVRGAVGSRMCARSISQFGAVGCLILGLIMVFALGIGFKPKSTVLKDFVEQLRRTSEKSSPGERQTIPLPALSMNQTLVLVAGPYGTRVETIRSHPGVSEKAVNKIYADIMSETGGKWTMVYLLDGGEIIDWNRVYVCDLRLLKIGSPMVIRPSDPAITLECVVDEIPCGFPGPTWNHKCKAVISAAR
jgi:hypothetical protein